MTSRYTDLLYRIEDEGLEYALIHYSDWDEIKDEEFHKLRTEFINARNKLIEFLELED